MKKEHVIFNETMGLYFVEWDSRPLLQQDGTWDKRAVWGRDFEAYKFDTKAEAQSERTTLRGLTLYRKHKIIVRRWLDA